MLLIIIVNIILISLAFIVIDLIGDNKEEKAIERYCEIECRSHMRHNGFHN